MVTSSISNCLSFWAGSDYSHLKTSPTPQPQLCFAVMLPSEMEPSPTAPALNSTTASTISLSLQRLSSEQTNRLGTTLSNLSLTTQPLPSATKTGPTEKYILYSGGQCGAIHMWDLEKVCCRLIVSSFLYFHSVTLFFSAYKY